MTDTIGRCLARHRLDYAACRRRPVDFDALFEAVGVMQRTLPNYSAADLASIRVPVTVAQAEHDEFIKPEHAAYIAATVPGAELVVAPRRQPLRAVQRPEVFNAVVLAFLRELVAA